MVVPSGVRLLKCVYLKYLAYILLIWVLTSLFIFGSDHSFIHKVLKSDVSNRQVCIHPRLQVNDPIMMKHFRKYPPIVCKGEDNWVYVYNGTLLFSQAALTKHVSFSCTYEPLIREGDYNYTWGEAINVTSGFQVPTDFFQINCTSLAGKRYEGILAAAAYTPQRAMKEAPPLKEGFEGLGVAILGFDSMSRMSWLRRLAKTREYFYHKLGAIELEGHNIVGDGTTAVLFPMLTGKFEWELPEARMNFPNASQLDDFPFIWHDFRKAGYLTSWSNANPKSAPFHWRMLGFDQQPTDFYTRPFYQAFEDIYPIRKRNCSGSVSFSRLWLNYFRDIFYMYKRQRKFLFHFLIEMTHDNNNLITKMDHEIKELVQTLYEGGYLNNTLLILMGDHGARYENVRFTIPGKLEERLPYFSFLFPKWFEEKYPEAIQNLRDNTKKLTTPFDIHETLKDFLKFGGTGEARVSDRGISLFKKIPLGRSCQHAGIAPHWCACLEWKKVPMTDPAAKGALRFTLKTINNYTAAYRDVCALLSVEKVTDATKMETRPEVVKFSEADSLGGFYKVVFNETNTNDIAMYQLTFYTTPGHGHFEVTVTHDIKHKTYRVSEKEISRINKYGNDPTCILKKNRQIRQYCYCISNLDS
ncbi:uncharacterized protein LOC106051006 [Biomphalaria glabrata]|uniref:Uncharacterized protein LOC106051006 n=1 Tax=Biomphalaria glabrata TaxID=6526 RepID=A0A9W3BDT8_BIOGL|nr:uncharacterized protein LOC106051006 [Biomphalaria glabrata]XP_055897603.1 uncharacterized protein LOC106051006 [Biomphalaria glabrata]XP_055897604.1 uncharacterized protein LOC106051006 [Biomphalaria glabrata]XP_055897605.1 uncharacterized protein LOC106051006 [Biomphalaria glabrata]